MVETYGLTHIALAVSDADRSLAFYKEVFGAIEVYRGEGMVQAQTPGSRDVLVFQENAVTTGSGSGVLHFGFRLKDPNDVDAARRAVDRAGGTVISYGDFCPGEPYVFFTDPDGYAIEIWYELPTPVDPPTEA